MNNDQAIETMQDYVSKLLAAVSGLALAGVFILLLLKLTAFPQISWLEVFLPIVVLLVASVALGLVVVSTSIVAGILIYGFAFFLGKVFIELNSRRAAQVLKEKLQEADDYDGDARQTVQRQSRKLTDVVKPIPYTQDDTRL